MYNTKHDTDHQKPTNESPLFRKFIVATSHIQSKNTENNKAHNEDKSIGHDNLEELFKVLQ